MLQNIKKCKLKEESKNMNFKNILLYILLNLILIQFNTIGALNASDNFKIDFLTNNNGLINNAINCLYEDKNKNIWIGTWDGLSIYNGRDFINLRYNGENQNSLSSNIIRQITEDNKNYIWISTDFGINRINPFTQKIERFYLGNERNHVKKENEFKIMIDNDLIYAYSEQTGLHKWDEILNTFYPIQKNLPPSNKIEISNNTLYFIDKYGKFQVYSISDTLREDKFSKLIKLKDIPLLNDFFVVDRYIVLITPQTYFIHDTKGSDNVYSYPKKKEDIVINILTKNDNIYVFFKDGNILELNIESGTQKIVQYAYSDISIFTSLFGSQNILWLGTDGKGLIKIYENKTNFNTVNTNYPVRDFEEYKGNILFATKGGGVGFYDKQNNVINHYLTKEDGLIDNAVYALKKNHLGDVFIGTEGYGLNVLRSNGKLETIELPTREAQFKSIYSIVLDESTNTLWLGTAGYGLIKIKYALFKDKYYAKSIAHYQNNLPNNTIYALLLDKENNKVWIGTRGAGLFNLNLTDDSISPVKQNILHEDILSLSKKEDLLWIGTSYGLNTMKINQKNDKDEEFHKHSIASTTIHGILFGEEQDSWLSTNNGLFRIYDTSGKVEQFTISDGLQNNEFSDGAYFKDSNKELFFGGVSGFNHFNPENIVLSNYQPEIALADLKLFNKSVNINDRIVNQTLTLSYNEKFATLDFISKDLIDTKNCKYKYRFKELTTDWIDNGLNSTISISNFPAGKYHLEVEATNSDGIWTTNSYHLKLIILPPFWLSTYAFLIYFLILLGLSYLTYKIINNRIKLNREILLNKIEHEHEKKIHESRINFFTNIAHEFFTPLTLIFTPAQYLLENMRLDLESKRYIQLIKNNASRMQRLISELMEFRKVEAEHIPLIFEVIHLKSFVDTIIKSFEKFKEENKIDLKCKYLNGENIISDKNSLEKIIYNLLSNALKYTPIFGYIHLTINVLDDCVYIDIKNSGKGLSEDKIDKIFHQFNVFDNETQFGISKPTGIGLSYTKNLVELLGGKITITSEINSYVNVSISIPSKKLDNVQNENRQETIPQERLIISNKYEKILIVEDNVEIQNLIVSILDNHYEIFKAKDGQEALSILESNSVDLVITDILMGYYDGKDLIKKLKEDNLLKHLPIIVISAKTTIEDQMNILDLGADYYITKPFDPQHLKTIIKNILTKYNILKDYYRSSISTISTRNANITHIKEEKDLKQIISIIEAHLESNKLDALEIASLLGVSKATLYRKIKDLLNDTPNGLIKKVRLKKAAQLLVTSTLTVEAIRIKVGFQNKSYFYREFDKEYHMTPLEYREKHSANFN